jgi:penicillin-binding protein-related factor A (putative recombinase)
MCFILFPLFDVINNFVSFVSNAGAFKTWKYVVVFHQSQESLGLSHAERLVTTKKEKGKEKDSTTKQILRSEFQASSTTVSTLL